LIISSFLARLQKPRLIKSDACAAIEAAATA
jgi:hypothetical protein